MMHDPFAHGAPAGDHHRWVDPAAGKPCPNCACCTALLCEQGRQVAYGCAMAARVQDREIVRACPCGTAPGTVEQQIRAAIARRDSPEASAPEEAKPGE